MDKPDFFGNAYQYPSLDSKRNLRSNKWVNETPLYFNLYWFVEDQMMLSIMQTKKSIFEINAQ